MSKRISLLTKAFEKLDGEIAASGVNDTSAADRSFLLIRQAIADLVLKPREPLSDKDLAQVLGVSKTPIRAALVRLASEGLVQIQPRSGTFVAPIVPNDLFEAMIIREALETTAVRLAARKAGDHDKFVLKEIMRRQREALEAKDAETFHRADDELHRAIATISGLPRLWTLLDSVRVTLNRVRYLAAPVPGRIERLIQQHGAVVDAILDNQPDQAAAAMSAHLQALYPFVEKLLRERPELFADPAAIGERRRKRSRVSTPE